MVSSPLKIFRDDDRRSTSVFPLIYASETIRYDIVYLTCSKKLTWSQLSLPHETNRTRTQLSQTDRASAAHTLRASIGLNNTP